MSGEICEYCEQYEGDCECETCEHCGEMEDDCSCERCGSCDGSGVDDAVGMDCYSCDGSGFARDYWAKVDAAHERGPL